MAPYDSESPGNNYAYVERFGGIPKISKPNKTSSSEKEPPSADWDRQEIAARALLEARLEMEKRGSTEAPVKKEPASVRPDYSEETNNRNVPEARLATEQSQRRMATQREQQQGNTARILVTPPSPPEDIDQDNVQGGKSSGTTRTLITPPPVGEKDLPRPEVLLKNDASSYPQEKKPGSDTSSKGSAFTKEFEVGRSFENKAQDVSMADPMVDAAPRTLITPPSRSAEGKEMKDALALDATQEAPKSKTFPEVARASKSNADPVRSEAPRALVTPPPPKATTTGKEIEPLITDLLSSDPTKESEAKAKQVYSEQAKEASRRSLLEARLALEQKPEYAPVTKNAGTPLGDDATMESKMPDPLSIASPATTTEGPKGEAHETATRKLVEARLAMEQKERAVPLTKETITTPHTPSGSQAYDEKQQKPFDFEGLSELDARVLEGLLQDSEQVDLKVEAPRAKTRKTRASQVLVDVMPTKRVSSVPSKQSKDVRTQEASMRKLLEARLAMEQKAKKRADANKEGYSAPPFVRNMQPSRQEKEDVPKVHASVTPQALTVLDATVEKQAPKQEDQPSTPMKSDRESPDVEDSLMNAASAVFINDLQRPKTPKKTVKETEPVLALSTTAKAGSVAKPTNTETSQEAFKQGADLAKTAAFALANGCAYVAKEGFQIAVKTKDNFSTTKVGAQDITYQEAVKKISKAVQGVAKIIIILVKDVVDLVAAAVPGRKGLSNTISDQPLNIADSSSEAHVKGDGMFASASSTFDAAVMGAFGPKRNTTATKKDGGDSPFFLDLDD